MAKIAVADMSFSAGRLRALDQGGWPMLRRALMSLTAYESDGVPTAAVDEYWRCYWNTAWFKTLTAEQAAAVVVHEVWHLLRFHFVRARALGARPEHAYVLNLVEDAEIHEGNDRLLAALKTMPDAQPVTRLSFDPPLHEGGVMESWYQEVMSRPSTRRVELNGVTVAWVPRMADRGDPGGADAGEHVLKLPPGCGGPGGSGATGRKASWELPGPEEGGPPGIEKGRTEVIRRAVAEDVRQHVKSRGTGEGGMRRWADEIINPVVDWRTSLQVGFQGVMSPSAGNVFWTYKRPCRRQSHDPRIVLPGYVNPEQRVAVLIDTSGSMSKDMLGLCVGEVTNLIGTLARNGNRPYVKVYACDARSTEAQQVWRGADVRLVGGGGTDLTVGFQKIEEDMKARHPYDVVVCMTDGHTPWPKKAFPVPVVTVLMSDGRTAPWLSQAPNRLVRVNMADVLKERPRK